MFGSMEDFDNLLDDIHARGMKLILDLVPNHSSDENEWFIESRTSRGNPKRDWYIWRDPGPNGGPPNNWLSFFGGPAWTYDEVTEQYYLHQFVTQQPELNYRHPEVLPAMLDVMRFWLDKGVDGFRVDVIWLMLKDELFRDEPEDPNWDGINPHDKFLHIHTANLPGVHDIIKKMRAVLDEYDERLMVGEIYLPNDELVKYYGDQREDGSFDECHLPFNFQMIDMPWDARIIREAVDAYDAALPKGGWPNWVMGNHDKHRIASRIGSEQARIANMMLLTLRGMPTTYYGEEIGMVNVEIPPEFIQDPQAVNQPEIAHIVGRDPERTPMQWEASPNAGFADDGVDTWLPVGEDFQDRNVDVQNADAISMLNLYRALTALRRTEPSLNVGGYTSVDVNAPDVYAYKRFSPGEDAFLVVLNFGDQSWTLDFSELAEKAVIEISTGMKRYGEVDLAALETGANEGLVIRL
jgi:alpha-glucosidase